MKEQNNYLRGHYTLNMVESYNISENEYDGLLDIMALFLNFKKMPLNNFLSLIADIGAICHIPSDCSQIRPSKELLKEFDEMVSSNE